MVDGLSMLADHCELGFCIFIHQHQLSRVVKNVNTVWGGVIACEVRRQRATYRPVSD
jgi:hypothetical protein